MKVNEDQAQRFVVTRRQMLQGCAVLAGTGLLAAHGTRAASALVADDPATGAGADGAPAAPGQPRIGILAVPPGGTSYNGWPVGAPASAIGVQNYVVPGTNVVLPIKAGDVATVLMYVAQRFNAEVETLDRSQCWGYDYRANVNNPSVWSNHASGTAMDLNAVKHANGARATFTAAQTAAVRRILAVCGPVVYWGQDYTGTVDGMHFEIDVPPGSPALTRLVASLRTGISYVPGLNGFIDAAGAKRVFGISPAGRLTELTDASGGWQALDAANGGYVLGTPGVTYANGRCDIFGIGGDGSAWTQHRSGGGGWSSWRRMGGSDLTGGITGVIDSAGTQHVFTVNTVGAIWQYIGSYENGWVLQNVSDGGQVMGSLAAVYRQGRYDVFGIGMDSSLFQHTYTEGSPGWQRWRRIGGSRLTGGLGVVRDANGAFRVLAINSDGNLRQFTSPDGANWRSADISNGGIVTGTPMMTQRSGRLDVFAIGMDQRVWTQSSANSASFVGWQPIGGVIG